jgi:hypothetical protein
MSQTPEDQTTEKAALDLSVRSPGGARTVPMLPLLLHYVGGLLHEGRSPTVPGPSGDALQSMSGGWRLTGAGTAGPVLLDRGVGM